MRTFMKRFSPAAVLLGIALLAVDVKAESSSPPTPKVDPAVHAAHAAANDPGVVQQLNELKMKMAQLESALAKSTPPSPTSTPAAGSMPGMAPAPAPMSMPPAPNTMNSASGMSTMTPASGPTNMMGMMEKMMGMMDKMMSMGGGAMSTGTPAAGMGSGGGMGMDKMEMGGGAMSAGMPAAGMSGGGGMGMDKMEMMGMMGMGTTSSGMAMQSSLPGFPGSSHLYHIGATGFFLDHPEHITLTTQQQAALNKAKEQALLAKNTAERAIQQAEQELWSLTAADQPDIAKVEAKIAEIEKLNGNQRLAFIRAVGESVQLLTDEQRKTLAGFTPPATSTSGAPTNPAPAAATNPAAIAPMTGGMNDM